MLKTLEKRVGRWAVSNLTIYIVAGQAIVFLAFMADPSILGRLVLIPSLVMEGEVWRVVAFPFIPPATNVIFLFFALYLFYLMGSALEAYWGTFRYNLYLLIAYLATIGTAWVAPHQAATNAYILTSVFLAFAFLYPDFVIHLFLILPIRIKWLAWITWILLGVAFLGGSWMDKALISASLGNFFLFFGRDIQRTLRYRSRKMQEKLEAAATADEPFHRCTACQRTDRTDPDLEFRYCPQCEGTMCYCMDHIHDHEHR